MNLCNQYSNVAQHCVVIQWSDEFMQPIKQCGSALCSYTMKRWSYATTDQHSLTETVRKRSLFIIIFKKVYPWNNLLPFSKWSRNFSPENQPQNDILRMMILCRLNVNKHSRYPGCGTLIYPNGPKRIE